MKKSLVAAMVTDKALKITDDKLIVAPEKIASYLIKGCLKM